MPNILLTGSSGILGNEIKQAFALISDSSSYKLLLVPGRDNFKAKVDSLFREEKIDIVIHAGFSVDFRFTNKKAKDASFQNENVINTEYLIQQSEKHAVEQFVFISAAAVYGVNRDPIEAYEAQPSLDSYPFRSWLETKYVQDKLTCEVLLKNSRLPYLILQPTTVYGDRLKPDMLPFFVRQNNNLPLAICPYGGTSFLTAEDFRRFLVKGVTDRKQGVYLLCSGNITYKDFLAAYLRLIKKRKTILRLPYFFLYLVFIFQHMLPGKHIGFAVLLSSFGFKYFGAAKAEKDFALTFRGSVEDCVAEIINSSLLK